MDFKNASWDDVMATAEHGGVVGPHQPLVELTLVLYDRKPAALINQIDVNSLRRLMADELIEVADRIDIRPIPKLAARNGWMYQYALFRKGNEKAYQDIVAAFDLYPGDMTGQVYICPSHDIALGRALGYREEDIAMFLVHNLDREQYEAWRRGEVDIVKVWSND